MRQLEDFSTHSFICLDQKILKNWVAPFMEKGFKVRLDVKSLVSKEIQLELVRHGDVWRIKGDEPGLFLYIGVVEKVGVKRNEIIIMSRGGAIMLERGD